MGRWLAGLLLLVWFAAGVGYLGLRYYVWPRLDQWRPLLVDRLSREIGHPVAVGRLQTHLQGLRPALTIEDLEVHDADGRAALRATSASLSLSLPRLLTGVPSIESLVLNAPSLTAEYFGAGQWRIAGFDLKLAPSDGEPDVPALRAALAVPHLEIRDGRFEVLDRVDDSRLAGSGLALQVRNDGRRHEIALTLPGSAASGESVQFAARLDSPESGDLLAWRDWRAEWFVGARKLSGTTLDTLSRLIHGHRMSAPIAMDGATARPDATTRREGVANPEALPDSVSGSGSGAQREADAAWFDDRLPLNAADVDLLAWGGWQQRSIADILVKLDARRPRWRLGNDEWVGALARLQAQWRVTAVDPATLRLDVDRLQLILPDGAAVQAAGGTGLQLTRGGKPLSATVALAPIELGALSNWARVQRWPAAISEPLSIWQGSGQLTQGQFVWRAEADASERAGWRTQFDFSRLSLSPRKIIERRDHDGFPLPTLPAFELASGQLTADDRGGRLQISGDKSGAWTFHGLFETPRLTLDQWSARLGWSAHDATTLRIDLDELRFANADAAGTASGVLRLGIGAAANGSADRIALTARLQRARANSVARYLPLVIPHEVRDWVAQAVKSGTSDDVRLTLDGGLHDFPYDKKGSQGRFRVETRIRDGVLAFAPDWPALEQLNALLVFDRSSMQASIDSGSLHGVPARGTRLDIPDMHHGVLGIEGLIKAPAQSMIALVNASPLAQVVNDALRETRSSGDLELKLGARIALNHHDPNRFDASLTLLDNDVVLGPGKPALTSLRGGLQITDAGVTTRDLNARLLGGPLRIDASAPTPGRVVLRAKGSLSLQAARELSDNPLTRKLDGDADYDAEIDIEPRGVRFSLSSDLNQVASELPAPFAKRAGQPMPLRIISTPAAESADGFVTAISLGDAVRMQIARRFDARAKRALIDRAAFAMNTDPVLPDKGLAVALHLPRVDFDAWGAALVSADVGQPDENLGGEFAPGFSLLPTQVSVLTDELLVGGKQLHDVVFGATRHSGLWQANVNAREVDGYFSWRDAPPGQPLGKLTARFTRLEIPPSRRQEIESFMETERTDLPELDVTAEELVLNNHRLGRLKLLAGNGSEAGRPAWKLQQLRIEHPAATLDASGIWSQRSARAGQARTTALDFKLDLADAGALLNDFGIHDAIRAAPGRIQGKVDWAGSPLSIDYPSLHGQIGIALGKGQFLKTDPGLAKLIGVLNLQSLPRRLSLDFRDIFAEGFAFDEIAGDVRIDHGVAHTDDLKMNGVQARVHLVGDADLARETQSLNVEVRPHLNAGLASLAYAAVNPVIGFGSFLAQFVLRKPLEAAFTYRYEVTGPWADPVVVEKSRTIEPDRQPQP